MQHMRMQHDGFQWELVVNDDVCTQKLLRNGEDALRTSAGLHKLLNYFLPQVGQLHLVGKGTEETVSPVSAPTLNATDEIVALQGEQTNASGISGDTVWKCYRQSVAGPHPDLEVPMQLKRHVAAPLAYITVGEFTVASAARWIPHSKDCWQLLQDPATAPLVLGRLPQLGAALREIHSDAQVLGTSSITGSELFAQYQEAVLTAVQTVPALAHWRDFLCSQLQPLLDIPQIPIQRIHGDLHLGQVLASPVTTQPKTTEPLDFYFIDFEGQPGHRAQRDLQPALRDLAGLVRSFHYAGIATPTALLESYGVTGNDETAVLQALIATRFAYEVAYEQQHRPTWVDKALATGEFLKRQ